MLYVLEELKKPPHFARQRIEPHLTLLVLQGHSKGRIITSMTVYPSQQAAFAWTALTEPWLFGMCHEFLMQIKTDMQHARSSPGCHPCVTKLFTFPKKEILVVIPESLNESVL